MIIKCKRIQCGSRLWLEMEIDCEKNNGPPTAKHYDANHEWETQFIDFRYFSNICVWYWHSGKVQPKSSLSTLCCQKKQIWFIFSHLFFVGFINNLKRFFCVCPKQTTKSVNVSSAEQQHNKVVRWRRGRWRSGKNRRARAEFIIQLSPFPTDWRGLSCVCVCVVNLLSFFCLFRRLLSVGVCAPPIPFLTLSLFPLQCAWSGLAPAALFFLYISNGTRAINCKQSERERQWVG